MTHIRQCLPKSTLPYFSKAIAIILLTYLITQWCFVAYAAFSIDEFWMAYHTYQYKQGLPYRDFFPYKSVLGYYVFLIPLSLSHGLLTPLLYTKVWITGINVIFLCIASFWLKKFFSQRAVLISLVLILSGTTFLMHSSEIRGDLLAYWLCLMSVLFIYDKKYCLAGVSIGLGFLICQKAVWYVIASNCGLAGYYFFNDRTWIMIKNIVLFNVSVIFILALYVVFWAYFSSYSIVLRSLFYEPYLISSIDWYDRIRARLWLNIVSENLESILLCLLAIIGLMVPSLYCRVIRNICLTRGGEAMTEVTFVPEKKQTFIIIYALIILLFIISSKQPFLYLPLAAVPALFVLFAAFFSATETCLYSPSHMNTEPKRLFTGLIVVLVIFSIGRFIPLMPEINGHYQKSMVHLVAKLLNDGESYVAGIPLLLDRDQAVPGLKHLVGPAIDYMDHPSEKLYSILTLPSFDFTPSTVPELIESIKRAPIKLYVDNNRFHFLPKELHRYLHSQYQHFWGSIYLYAPKIDAGHHIIPIKFTGNYRVNATTEIMLDHKKIAPNTTLHLLRRDYTSDASSSYRLELIPADVKNDLDPRYKENHWEVLLSNR